MSQTNVTEEVLGSLSPSMAGEGNVINPSGSHQEQPKGAAGQSNAPMVDFMTVARRAMYSTAMSSEGADYIQRLKNFLEEKNGMLQQKVKAISLSYPPETMAIVSGNDAIILLFAEAISKDDAIPTIAYSKNAKQSLEAVAGNNIKIHNYIVVTPEDYPKVTTMGAHLLNVFASLSSPDVQKLDINSMKNYFINVSTSKSIYDSLQRSFNPHGTVDRAELFMSVNLSPVANKVSGQSMFDQVDKNEDYIAAIGAYVTFSQVQGPMDAYAKYIPEIHISNITTGVLFDGILPLLLSLAVKTLIDDRYWLAQFSDIGGKGPRPNIGNLLLDTATGKPFRVENLAQRDELIRVNCEPPTVVIDVVEGRARIPGLENYALPNAGAKIIESYSRFLGEPIDFTSVAAPVMPVTREYSGTFHMGSSCMDSRWCDFLNLVAHHPGQYQQLKAMLGHYTREEDFPNLIKQYFPDLNLYYVNHMVMPVPQLIRTIQQIVTTKLKIVNGQSASGMVDVSGLLNAGRSYQQNPQGTYYSQQANPFTQLYGQGGIQRTMF